MEEAPIKYKPGQQLTHKPTNSVVTVVHNSLKPGGVNEHEAVVTVRTKQNSLISVPVDIQDQYLTTEPPKKGFLAKWPLPKQ